MKMPESNQEVTNTEGKITGETSDGYHTFNELYHHRMVLFSIICNSNKDKAFKSKLHADGTMFDDYFIVGVNTPEGHYTYHYHINNWDRFQVKELEHAPEWDGHQPCDIDRLLTLESSGDCPIEEGDEFDFGSAIYLMQKGERVMRAGWNGKGMFIYIVPAASYPAQRNAKGVLVGDYPNDMVPYSSYIALKSASGEVVPWTISQSDALATDWCLA
jgi:hypothetical protein